MISVIFDTCRSRKGAKDACEEDGRQKECGHLYPLLYSLSDQNGGFARRQQPSWADPLARDESIAGLTRSHLIADYWLERTEGRALCMPEVASGELPTHQPQDGGPCWGR